MVFSGQVTYPKELFSPPPEYDVTMYRLFIVNVNDGAITPLIVIGSDVLNMSGSPFS